MYTLCIKGENHLDLKCEGRSLKKDKILKK